MNRITCCISVIVGIFMSLSSALASPDPIGLQPVKNSKLDKSLVRPDVDWSQYSQLLVATLDVSNIEVIQPREDAAKRQLTFELNDVDRQLLQGLYAQTLYHRLFEEAKFDEARLPGPNILMLRMAITQVAPTAARDTHDGRPSNTTMITRGGGTISMKGILQDGESGELLAYFEDTRNGSAFYGLNTPSRNRREIMRVFDSWAKLFVQKLEEVLGAK